jgi:ABC-type nitrate/sulfonate/bicarbonate transport system permease component
MAELVLRPARQRAAPTRWTIPPQAHKWLVAALSMASFLLVWEVVGSQDVIRAELISYPTEVLVVTARLLATGELARHAAVSILEFTAGFVPSLLIGLPLGLMLGQSRRLRYLLDPALMAIYTMPRIALLPRCPGSRSSRCW